MEAPGSLHVQKSTSTYVFTMIISIGCTDHSLATATRPVAFHTLNVRHQIQMENATLHSQEGDENI